MSGEIVAVGTYTPSETQTSELDPLLPSAHSYAASSSVPEALAFRSPVSPPPVRLSSSSSSELLMTDIEMSKRDEAIQIIQNVCYGYIVNRRHTGPSKAEIQIELRNAIIECDGIKVTAILCKLPEFIETHIESTVKGHHHQ